MPAKFSDLKRFCEKNGWVPVRNTDHWYYEKVLANGDLLGAKVSHAVHREIPGQLWQRILRKQLRMTEQDFWRQV